MAAGVVLKGKDTEKAPSHVRCRASPWEVVQPRLLFFGECMYFLKLPEEVTKIVVLFGISGLRKGAWRHGTGLTRLCDNPALRAN